MGKLNNSKSRDLLFLTIRGVRDLPINLKTSHNPEVAQNP